MQSIIIHALEALALGLAAYVGARVVVLNKRQAIPSSPVSSSNPMDHEQIIVEESDQDAPQNKIDEYQSRADALKKAQIFCGIQMIPVKREFTNLNDPQLHWLREAIAFYLAGAADFFSKQARCDSRTASKFSGLVLSTNLRLDEQAIKRVQDLLRSAEIDSDEDKMFLAGSAAAKLWSETQEVTNVLRLRTRLNDWGVFA